MMIICKSTCSVCLRESDGLSATLDQQHWFCSVDCAESEDANDKYDAAMVAMAIAREPLLAPMLDCQPEKLGIAPCGSCRSCLKAMIELRDDQLKSMDDCFAAQKRELHAAHLEIDRLKRELEAAGMRWPQTVSTLEAALKSFPVGRIWLDQWTRAEVERDRRITPEAHALELTKLVNEAIAEATEETAEGLFEDVVDVVEDERGFAPDPIIDRLKVKLSALIDKWRAE